MTLRATLVGLVCVAIVCIFTYFNDMVLGQTPFIGNFLPVFVYGAFVFFILALNPLLHFLHRRLAFTGSEIAVVLALTLAACVIPGAGLLYTFCSSLALPHHYKQTAPGWQGETYELKTSKVSDWHLLAQKLGTGSEADLPAPAAVLRRQLPERTRARLAAMRRAERINETDKRAVVEAINAVLEDPAFAEEASADLAGLPDYRREDVAKRVREIAYIEESVAEFERELPELVAERKRAETHFENALARRRQLLDQQERMSARARSLMQRRDSGEISEEAYENARETALEEEKRLREDLAALAGALTPLDKILYRLQTVEAGLESLPEALQTERRRLGRLLVDASFPDALEARERGIVEAAPQHMLAEVRINRDDALVGLIQGKQKGETPMPVHGIPWYAWARPLFFWLPLVLAIWLGLVALALVVHRQWSDHEHLPYPISNFANSLLPNPGQMISSVFRNPIFWLAFAFVAAIHVNNYVHAWFPDWPLIPRSFDFQSLYDANLFPIIKLAGERWFFKPALYFSIIAFAYFLPTDVSLGLGVSRLFYVYAVGILAAFGISMGSADYMALKPPTFFHFGAYFGIFLALAYTGRQYYLTVARRALFLPTRDRAEPASVWGFRVFVVCMVFATWHLVNAGLDWQLAVLYLAILLLAFLVMGRIIAETGLFFIQPYFFPCVGLWGLMGAKALGMETLLFLFMLTIILAVDPRETLMPFMVNSLKLLDMRRVGLGRVGLLCGVAIVVGLAVGLPATFYWHYNYGAAMHNAWITRIVPMEPFKEALRVKSELISQNSLEAAASYSGFERFFHLAPDWPSVAAFVIGLGLVLLFTAGRLRFPKWPLHPVMFLVCGTYPLGHMWFSFLVGWFLKVMVTKYGGSAQYQRLKPLMFGIVSGEMLSLFFINVFGLLYYFVSLYVFGVYEKPPAFRIMP